MLDPVSSRTVSGLPLSVGTSLAFESVFEATQQPIDTGRNIPQFISLSDYDEVWINVGTLFRNMFNSIDKDGIKYLTANDMADGIVSELNVIKDLINQYSFEKIKTVFYICSYDDLTSRFKLGSLRLPNTDKQHHYSNLYKETLRIIKRKSDLNKITEVMQFDSKFSSPSKKALIFTHFPIDLLNVHKFRELDLLESHTGILKKQPEWYTKYYDGRDLNILPLNGILLTVFGDDHHFRPQPKAMKIALLDLAKDRKWNCLSTPNDIVNGIKTLKDHALRDSLLLQDQR